MIDSKTAKNILGILKKFYRDFDVDLDDNTTLYLWSIEFQNLTTDEFNDIVIRYCKSHKYSPRSPNDLKEVIIDEIKNTSSVLTPFQAWQRTCVTLSNYDFYHRPRTASEKLSPACKKAYIELEPDFHAVGYNLGNEQYCSKLRERFMKLYSENVELEINDKVKNYLTYDRTTLLDNGADSKPSALTIANVLTKV